MTDKSDLVERRLKYIKRQIALDQGTVNVRFRGMRPEGSGPVNRHGMPALPVGQHEVKNWPVLDLGEQPVVTLAEWKLEVGGLTENPLSLRWDQFLALPQVEDVSDFHCVTTWSRFNNQWRGVRFKTIAELAVPHERAHYVECTGYDFAPGTYIPYTTNLPLARAVDDDVLLVHTWEGQPLPREHGGPCRMITPKLYAWKGAKWIRKIEFLAEDRKGFWEVRGYSNSAEPWFNDRYATG
ncbi:MAG TPA: molybdopterin-dependent oxidoreductase [Vicinamibacterales bacterium]|nr:molybdopterin-dependent oxidoreductase [Vicinamibacterales bacterium]